jgi:PTH1 family peptidyl-tRNA hydrolase
MFWRWITSVLAPNRDKEIQAELSEDGSSVSFDKEENHKEEKAMWLLVGLGNPGNKYAANRHNVGFMAVDAIADVVGFGGKFRSKYQGEIAEGSIAGSKVLLLKPQTYMNLSGQSVAAAARFYKIAPEQIIVFHDEIDIEPNTVRVKKGGGTAGHNGLKSIQADLGTPEYWRVRIGIGKNAFGGDVSDHVLSDFSKDEQIWVGPLLRDLSKEVKLLIQAEPKAYEKKINELINKRKSATQRPE